jgi:hypothetical protein
MPGGHHLRQRRQVVHGEIGAKADVAQRLAMHPRLQGGVRRHDGGFDFGQGDTIAVAANRLATIVSGQGWSVPAGVRTGANEADCDAVNGTLRPAMTRTPSRATPATTLSGRLMEPMTAPRTSSRVSLLRTFCRGA